MKRSTALTCAAMIVDNGVAMFLPRLVHGSAPIEDPEGKAERLVALYGTYVPLRGRFCEIGPGGTDAIARLLIERGCSGVDQADRFGPPIPSRDERIRTFIGAEGAAEDFFETHNGYDAIVSSAVLEHCRDPLLVVEAMAGALRPGGGMVHEVDLRDHGMFHDPRAFLRVPDWLWPAMTCHASRPNRVLLHRYRETLDRLGLDYRIEVTSLVGVGPVETAPFHELPAQVRMTACRAVRQAAPLARSLRNVPVEDLAVSGFLLVAHRPAARADGPSEYLNSVSV